MAPQEKKPKKPAATSEARGTAERVEAALPQHRFLLPQRAASASLVLARHPVLRRPRSLSLPLCGEGPRHFCSVASTLGLHTPKTPKEEVALAKTGKNAWKDCFSIGFSDSPLLIRVCPNPCDEIVLCKKGMVCGPCLFWLEFLFRIFTGNKVGVSLPTFFAKKVGPCLCGRGHGIIRATQDRRRALGPRRFAPKEVAS